MYGEQERKTDYYFYEDLVERLELANKDHVSGNILEAIATIDTRMKKLYPKTIISDAKQGIEDIQVWHSETHGDEHSVGQTLASIWCSLDELERHIK